MLSGTPHRKITIKKTPKGKTYATKVANGQKNLSRLM